MTWAHAMTAHDETPIRQITKDGKWTVEELRYLAPNQLLAGVQNPAAPPPNLEIPGRPVQAQAQAQTPRRRISHVACCE